MRDVRLTCQPGDPAKPNEDGVVAVPGLLAVLDGVTAPDGLDTGCVHDPAWYVRRLTAHLTGAYLAAPDRDLAEIVARAIAAVREEHVGTCDPDNPYGPQSTLVVLRVGTDRCDYLLLGDSTIVLDRAGRTEAVTDRRGHEVGRRVKPPAPQHPAPLGSPEHAERNRAGVFALRRYVNRPDGYWVAGGDPAAAEHAVRGSAPRTGPDGLTRAALLTDGASCLVDRYGLADWPGLLDLIESQGAPEVVARARAAERDDPDGLRWPRPKRHDDATVAYCRLAG